LVVAPANGIPKCAKSKAKKVYKREIGNPSTMKRRDSECSVYDAIKRGMWRFLPPWCAKEEVLSLLRVLTIKQRDPDCPQQETEKRKFERWKGDAK
jgi:hypothetical protein